MPLFDFQNQQINFTCLFESVVTVPFEPNLACIYPKYHTFLFSRSIPVPKSLKLLFD